jgi:hypothetical protein
MTLRDMMNETVNVNLTSVAVLTTEFLPLLHKSSDPKVGISAPFVSSETLD